MCWFVQVEECSSSVYSGSALCLEQTLGLRLNISPRPCCALCTNRGGATRSSSTGGSVLVMVLCQWQEIFKKILGELMANPQKNYPSIFFVLFILYIVTGSLEFIPGN